MISFEISPEMKMLTETLERFVLKEVVPLEGVVEERGYLPDELRDPVKKKAMELGLFALGMPTEVGGGGLSAVELCLADEKIGWVSNALSRHIFGQMYPMLLECTGSQREKYLLPNVQGLKKCAMAITEPGAGSDAASIATTATRSGSDFVLNGTKHFISDGDTCDFVVVLAVTDPALRARGGISLFLVDKDTPGFAVGRTQKMMGMRGCNQVEMVFDSCRIPETQLLGKLGDGFRIIQKTLGKVRLGNIGARAIGMASRVLELSRVYATERVQFGKPIGDYQMVQKMIADMALDIYAARNMVLNAAWDLDQGRDAREKVAMVKVYCSEMAGRVADLGIQIFGGMGYTTDLPLERIYRDCRVMRIYDGTSEIHRIQIAKSVMRNGLLLD